MRALLHFLFHAPPIEIHTHSFHIPFHALTVLFKFNFLQFKMKLFKFNLHMNAFNFHMLIFQFIVTMIVMVVVMPTPVVTAFVMAILVIPFLTITFMPLANGHANPFEPGFLLGKFSILDALLQLFSVLSQIGVRIMPVMPVLVIMPAMSPISFIMPTFFMVFFFLLAGSCHPLGPGILLGKFSVLDGLLQF